MYRNKNMAKLAQLLARHELPGHDEVDWAAVYHFWLQHHRIRSASPPARSELELYDSRARTANSRAKHKGAPGMLTAVDLLQIIDAANHRCAACGRTEHLVFDHIVPYYRGGTNYPDNIQVLCRLCNMEKGVH